MADGSLPVVVCPEAFGRAQFDLNVVEGTTVKAMLVEAVRQGLPADNLCRAEIYIDGERLDRETALDHVLRADEVVNVVVEPMGGGGGGRKNVGQILLQIAVIAVATWVGGGAGGRIASQLFARVAAAAVMVAGNMAINAMFAPDNKVTKANDSYALQTAANQYRSWGPQPIALGEVLVAPDLAAKTFTESVGDDVWMYGILGLHRGPCEIDALKIGDTLASSMGAGDWRMVAHLEPGPRTFSLYPNDVDQLDLTEKLEATPSSATPVVRASSSDGSRFDFDFYLPEGLYFAKSDGRIERTSVGVTIRYRSVDNDGVPTGSWANTTGWTRYSTSKDPQRITHRVSLPHGRYEFEVSRTRPADVNDKRHDTVVWTALKSVAFRKPILDEQLSIIEFAVRASAVNQGGLAPITCRIKPKIPVWTGTEWGAPQVSSNPAALTRWLMTGPCAAQPLLSDQADVGLRAWYGLCEQYNWTAHHYLTERRSQEEVLALLEKSGRASVFWDGTQLVGDCWVEKPAPKQMFTGVNLRDHTFDIAYPDPVHALRVEFANLDKNGEPDELFVFADGYGEIAGDGIEPATLIEALRLDGQMKPERAYRDGRWALGQRIHQRRTDSWTCDAEYLASSYGSRVRLAWDRANGPSARVRCRRLDGEKVIGLRLDQPVEVHAGRDYVVDFRTPEGVVTAVPVVAAAGWQRELNFVTPRAAAVSPAAGDLVAFGEPERVTEDVEILFVAPGPNLTAQLVGVRYVAPLLMQGETGPIPPLTSRLSLDRSANPPQPVLLGTQVDANGVRISFDMPSWRGAPISGFTVRWRGAAETGEMTGWEALPALDANARILRAPALREAPVEYAEGEATRAEVEIVATTVDGRVSKPLQVTVRQPVPPTPTALDWAVVPRTVDVDGSSQPYLVVSGSVDRDDVKQVAISYSLTAQGPWTPAYSGDPQAIGYQVGPLVAGADYYVRIQFLSAQGVPSHSLVKGPVQAPSFVAGDTTHLKGEPVQDVLDKLTGAAELSAQNALAVADLDGRVDDTITAAQAAIAAGEAASLAVLKAGEAGEAASASNISAGIATTKADEAGASASSAVAAKVSASAARDGAIAALLQQGRTNLVSRSNVQNQGLIVSFAAPSLSGWGFKMIGTGTNQTRTILIGPLKKDTAYSISFVATLVAGTGPQPMNVDLYPDTLPERVVSVTSTPTLFKLEELISSHNDMLGAVSLRFFRSPLPSGQTIEVTDIKLEEGGFASAWTPSPQEAPEAARAAASSASSASASQTAAGQSASAASASATNAATNAGQALTHRNAASDARDGAVAASLSSGTSATASRDAADDAEADRLLAQGAAATAVTQSSNATAAAQAAAISADLASGISVNANLMPNGSGENGTEGWSSPLPGFFAADWAPFGGRIIKQDLVVGAVPLSYILAPRAKVEVGQTVTASWRGWIENFTGTANVYIVWRNSSNAWVGETSRVALNAATRKITGVVPAGATHANINIAVQGTASVGSGIAIARAKIENGPNATAYTTDQSDLNLQASLNLTMATTADVANRMASARFGVTGGAGGDPFDLELQAGPEGSTASLTATALRLKNIVGGAIHRVMDIVGGFVHVMGPLYIGPNREIELNPISGYPFISIRVGTGRMAMGRLPNDSLIYWFGPFQEVVNMRKSNATEWRDTNGRAYFGGSILSGTLRNSVQGSNSTVPASVTLGPFSTNGAPITIVWSYDLTRQGERWGKQDTTVSGSTSAVVRLYRKIGTGAEALVDTQVINGSHSVTYEGEVVPGQPSGTIGKTYFTEYAGGSRTYTDNVGGTQQRTYRVEVASRSTISVAGDSALPDETRQGYGAVSSE